MRAKQHPLLAMQPQSARGVGEAVHPVGEIGISVATVIVDNRRLGVSSGREVALEQIGSRVVGHRRAPIPAEP